MNDAWPLILCIGIPALIIAVIIYDQEQRKKKIAKAKKEYNDALDMLRKNTNNNELREYALACGRYYATLAANDKRTMFDEVALMNDLNAIQATTAQPAPAPQENKGDVKTRLANLESLYKEEIITKEEYETRRNQILSEV